MHALSGSGLLAHRCASTLHIDADALDIAQRP